MMPNSVEEDAQELAGKLKEFAGRFRPDWIEHQMLNEAAEFVLKCARRHEARTGGLAERVKARRGNVG